MPTNTSASAVVGAQSDSVFALLTDIDRLGEWNSIVTRVLQRPAVLEAGAEWVVEMHAMGQTWASRSRVEEIDPSARRFRPPLGQRRRQSLVHGLAVGGQSASVRCARDGELGPQPEDVLAPASRRPSPSPRPGAGSSGFTAGSRDSSRRRSTLESDEANR
jgi:hypothetical protein